MSAAFAERARRHSSHIGSEGLAERSRARAAARRQRHERDGTPPLTRLLDWLRDR